MKQYSKLFSRILLCLTAAVAVAGFFLRRRQLATQLLPGGFPAEGSYLHIVLGALAVLLVLGCAILLLPQKKTASWAEAFPGGIPGGVVRLIAAISLLAGNVLLLLSSIYSTADPNAPAMAKVLSMLEAPLGICAALCMGIFALLRLYGKKPSALLCMAVSLYMAVRLIDHFQQWNTDPSVQNYCYSFLAAVCGMLGCFHLSEFSFGSGKCRISLFWCLTAVGFTAISLADALYAGDVAELLVHGAVLLFVGAGAAPLLHAKDFEENGEKS